MLTRTLVAWNSDVANLDTIVPSSWDYRQPTQPVLAAIRQMSYDTAALWKLELHEAAMLLGEFRLGWWGWTIRGFFPLSAMQRTDVLTCANWWGFTSNNDLPLRHLSHRRDMSIPDGFHEIF